MRLLRSEVAVEVRGSRLSKVLFCSVLFFSRPRPESWSHHGRTFSIYLCPLVILTDSSTESPVHVLMLSTQAVRGLPRLRAPVKGNVRGISGGGADDREGKCPALILRHERD